MIKWFLASVWMVLAFPSLAERPHSKLEETYRQDALMKFSQLIAFYKTALVAYQQDGPEEFIQKLPANLSIENKKYLKKRLGTLQELPSFELRNGLFIISSNSQLPVQMDAYQAAQGIFQIEGENYVYNPNLELFENAEIWIKNLENQSAFWNSPMQYIFPSAHAAKKKSIFQSPLTWVGLSLVGWLGWTHFQSKKHLAMNPASEGSATGGHSVGAGGTSQSGKANFDLPKISPVQPNSGAPTPMVITPERHKLLQKAFCTNIQGKPYDQDQKYLKGYFSSEFYMMVANPTLSASERLVSAFNSTVTATANKEKNNYTWPPETLALKKEFFKEFMGIDLSDTKIDSKDIFSEHVNAIGVAQNFPGFNFKKLGFSVSCKLQSKPLDDNPSFRVCPPEEIVLETQDHKKNYLCR